MVGWYHRPNGHEFEQTQGDSEEQGSLACCSSWGHKEWEMTLVTEQLIHVTFSYLYPHKRFNKQNNIVWGL